ncbi:MAG: phosphomannomutase/phosphoglucomutase [Proteobacteria bacterium]|nr:phosphomannomutase/phosphoglucomutase [Pseudomonadota bacterium]MBU4472119.1 phosphomannomutase/phosphoglucomutase [Pseudomonadota bacterium]MCG2752882.1 phosphomannomutase/phosphoglucomutase [Desulfobacteraceae bacterium]
MNPEIFREYDIRGIAGKDMTDQEVFILGKGIGTYLKRKGCSKLNVGRDCRLTSDTYARKMIQGLRASGCDVKDLGVCPTPVFYFSIQHLKQQGGVMVTASHNPKEYNGFKVCKNLDSVYGEELKKIHALMEKEDFEQGQGAYETVDAMTPYKHFVLENIKLSKPLKIGIDAGNGTGGLTALPILKGLGCEVHDLYCDMDGTFPNHEADPTVAKNMKDLIALVAEKKLDLGIGFDGDSDRIGVVDEKGNMIFGDQLMVIFSREILSRKPGAVFISEVKCSQTLYDDIEKNGGKAVMWRTGHSLIKKKMKEEKAELAGEMSGHVFFADRYFGYDDAVYAGCRLLEILADTGKTISQLLAGIPKTFSTPEIRVDCPDNIKFAVVEKVTAHFKKTHKVIDIDGARVLFEEGWGLVRASNTQPAMVLRFEALSSGKLEEIRKTVESVLDGIKAAF